MRSSSIALKKTLCARDPMKIEKEARDSSWTQNERRETKNEKNQNRNPKKKKVHTSQPQIPTSPAHASSQLSPIYRMNSPSNPNPKIRTNQPTEKPKAPWPRLQSEFPTPHSTKGQRGKKNPKIDETDKKKSIIVIVISTSAEQPKRTEKITARHDAREPLSDKAPTITQVTDGITIESKRPLERASRSSDPGQNRSEERRVGKECVP